MRWLLLRGLLDFLRLLGAAVARLEPDALRLLARGLLVLRLAEREVEDLALELLELLRRLDVPVRFAPPADRLDRVLEALP